MYDYEDLKPQTLVKMSIHMIESNHTSYIFYLHITILHACFSVNLITNKIMTQLYSHVPHTVPLLLWMYLIASSEATSHPPR